MDSVIINLLETPCSETSSSSSDNCSTIITTSSASEESTNTDNEIEDGIIFYLMKYIMSGQRKHCIENYLEIVDVMTEHEFKMHFRLSRPTVLNLIEELQQSTFLPSNTFGWKPISAKLSILIYLWFIANTEPLRTLSDRFNVSISSIFRVLRRVVKWLLTKADEIIRWPQGHEFLQISEEFKSKQGINNVVGAIDATHVQIVKPKINARYYCNRKKFFSINLQAVVDSKLCFRNIYCGEPGSLHDARVFRRSLLYETATSDKNAIFPNGSFILGDSAYPSLPWLVPPFKDNGHLTSQQHEFNFMHSSTRIVVEKAFGQLKGRFRRIKFFSEYRDLSFITNTVAASCILHNYCVRINDTYDFNECNDNYLDEVDNNSNDTYNFNTSPQTDRRMQLFNEIFPNI